MSSKIGINLKRLYSNNFDATKRSKNLIKFIIIHYTGMKNQSNAISRLCDSESKVSSHYFIKNNGEILNLVPDLYRSWHAGKSKWKNFKSLNKYSIGIELNNPGHDHGYKKFTSRQVFSLIKLLNFLIKKYKIKKQNILGHSDISPNRKKDPGEKFPWKYLAQNKVSFWHNFNEKNIRKFRNLKLELSEEKKFIKNLYKLGYPKQQPVKIKYIVNLVKSFQRRFRQELINGKIDKECLMITQNLIKLSK